MKTAKGLVIYSLLLLLALPVIGYGQHKLTMKFRQMGVHVGQLMQIRVVDKLAGLEVGHTSVASIPGAEFEVDLYVLVVGHSYYIDFYADHNNNKQYDAPPVDHAYRLELDNVEGDEELTFVHNTEFTDIQWQFEYETMEFAGAWHGRWWNLTYGTTDSLTLFFEIDEDSQKVKGSLTTTGAFGNPDTLTISFEGPYEINADTIRIVPPAPWTGEIVLTEGQIYGSVTQPSLFGAGIKLDLIGNFGLSQVILNYTMSRAFSANGVILASRDVETSVGRDFAKQEPVDFQLDQNYPNPFNPITTIRYQLSEVSDVNLSIYNVNGQLVRTLVAGQQNSGFHFLKWDATDNHGRQVNSGVYICRLQIGNQVLTQRMLYLK